jgi:hypothetical protein
MYLQGTQGVFHLQKNHWVMYEDNWCYTNALMLCYSDPYVNGWVNL